LQQEHVLSTKPSSRPNHRRPAQRGEPFNAHMPGIGYGALDDLIGYALRRAQIRIYQDFLDAVAPWSITPPRFSAMTIIQANPGLKLTTLAQAMGIARSGVVQVVNSLEKLGYVERTAFSSDKRAYALLLTAEGTLALETITQEISAHDARVSAALTEGEKMELRRLLDLLGSYCPDKSSTPVPGADSI
jgi:DNA-binding MarR family transcriptional regulator